MIDTSIVRVHLFRSPFPSVAMDESHLIAAALPGHGSDPVPCPNQMSPRRISGAPTTGGMIFVTAPFDRDMTAMSKAS
jgi:hypothetical protein